MAAAVVYSADYAQPLFSYVSVRGTSQCTNLLETPERIPESLVPRVCEYICRSAPGHAVVTRAALAGGTVGKTRLALMGLAINRALERTRHNDPTFFQGLSYSDIHVFYAGHDPIPETYVSNMAQHGELGDDWRVGAASVLAHKSRNSTMASLAQKYPEYGFDQHQGYPTAMHRRILKRLGPTPEHRHAARAVSHNHLHSLP